MGMGSAYSGGAGMVKRPRSYVPLMNSTISAAQLAADIRLSEREMALKERMYADQNKGGGGRSGGGGRLAMESAGMARERRAEEKAEQERQDEWSRKNQYMATHHGREPTPEELAETDYERGLKERNIDRAENTRQFDVGQAFKESQGVFNRAQKESEAERKEKETGLKGRRLKINEEEHRWKKDEHRKRQDQVKRGEEYFAMQVALKRGDRKAVEAYFKKTQPPGVKGDFKIKFLDNGKIQVKFPGKDLTIMDKKTFEAITATGSPNYEVEKGEKPLTKDQKEKIAAKYATGASKNDEISYEAAHKEKMKELDSEGEGTHITKKEVDKATGHIREEDNKGFWVIKDEHGAVIASGRKRDNDDDDDDSSDRDSSDN